MSNDSAMRNPTGSSAQPVIGFIGLGAIGAPIAKRLLDHGHRLIVRDARPEASAPFDGQALIARSAREVGDSAEIVFGCLASLDSHRDALLGAEGLIQGAKVRLYVNLSTLGVPGLQEIASALAQRKIDTLDAPVTGGVPRARTGDLTSIVSGNPDHFERIRSLSSSYASKQVWLGPQVGNAQIMKVVNNAVSLANMVIAGEAMLVGAKAGIDPRAMIDVINSGSGQNSATLSKIPAEVLTARFQFGGSLAIVVKDLRAFIAEASEQGVPVQAIQTVLDAYERAMAELGPNADITEVIRPIERLAHVELRDAGGNVEVAK
jgi:2-hydroxy-3-oxopropionate reductase